MKFIDQSLLQKLTQLRHNLKDIPELSGKEFKTRALLIKFLKQNTNLEIHDLGTWFYAIQRVNSSRGAIVFRADHDAILHPDGYPFHGCGHDGHSTILAGLALLLQKEKLEQSIIFLFQPSEENGQGAKQCLKLFDLENVERIYGLHNFPGFELGHIITRVGTFMCASLGLTVRFTGHQTHAATPEKGTNPAFAISQLTQMLEPLSYFNGFESFKWKDLIFSSMVLATVVSIQVGQANHFGISPSNGSLQLTLRAEKQQDLSKLLTKIKETSLQLAKQYNLTLQFEVNDEFVETTNPESLTHHVNTIFSNDGLHIHELVEPFRPSEDFGYYQLEKPGVFFGIGSGLQTPPLHSHDYVFPDEIIPYGIRAFYSIVMN